ncbi:MAG TPA: DUF4129 domain-containing protein [Candidatus Dormibacteraeota bacterium]|nr:DUF4129 domain-containing protein [Candidatus Dormibacteraeota bacterium]
MKPRAIEEHNPYELIEEAFYLLRRASGPAWAAYYLGSLPFVLGLLYFWSDMARSAFAADRLFPGSIALTAGFIWMKAWQGVFARHLHASLCGEPPPVWRWRWWTRTAIFQAFLQPPGLFLLPVSLVLMIPFGWLYAFFSNATVFSGVENANARFLIQRAWRQARLWPMLNHNLLFNLVLFCLFVFANLYGAVLAFPFLLDRFLGIPSVFTQAPWAAMNSTVTAAVAGLSYLCCDPLLKAVYTLRCFYGESLVTGQDLRAELRKLQGDPASETDPRPILRGQAPARILALLLTLFIAVPLGGAVPETELEKPDAPRPAGPPAAVPAPALERSIEHVIQKREYSWRLPRENVSRKNNENESPIEWLSHQTQAALKAVARWVSDLLRWVMRQLTPATGSGVALAFAIEALVILLVGALLAFLGWLLWRLWRDREPKPELDAEALAPAPNLADENVGADQLPEDGWVQLARELLGRGELRLALRAFYLATLAHLAQRNLITLARFKSNQDYERELQRRGHSLHVLFEHFSQNRLIFERVWYGRHEITPRALHEFAGTVERIQNS